MEKALGRREGGGIEAGIILSDLYGLQHVPCPLLVAVECLVGTQELGRLCSQNCRTLSVEVLQVS